LNMFELGIIRVFDGFTTIYEMPKNWLYESNKWNEGR
jgi:hypothetical protein